MSDAAVPIHKDFAKDPSYLGRKERAYRLPAGELECCVSAINAAIGMLRPERRGGVWFQQTAITLSTGAQLWVFGGAVITPEEGTTIVELTSDDILAGKKVCKALIAAQLQPLDDGKYADAALLARQADFLSALLGDTPVKETVVDGLGAPSTLLVIYTP